MEIARCVYVFKKRNVQLSLPLIITILFMYHVSNTFTKSEHYYVNKTLKQKENVFVNNIQTNNGNSVDVTANRTFEISLYYPKHRMLQYDIQNITMTKCLYNNCRTKLEWNATTGILDTDAVIMVGNEVPWLIPRRRDQDQIFVFLSIEAPQYLSFTNYSDPIWRNYYNWTMTYRRDSDIPYLYGAVLKRPQTSAYAIQAAEQDVAHMFGDLNSHALNELKLEVRDGKSYKRIFKSKSRNIAWMVSHCETASRREDYVENMMKYTNVDIFGRCMNGTRCSWTSRECEEMIMAKYKFYLAFENSMCTDYITEKVFYWFTYDIITVVRGTLNYADHLPAGTYIDANDFKSQKELSVYLSDLANDEERYTEMLRRKDMYVGVDPLDLSQLAYCNLCKRLNNLEKYRKSLLDISSFWVNGQCKMPEDL